MGKDRLEVIELADNGSPLVAIGGVLIGVACVIIAVAVWQASVGLSIGFAAAGIGLGSYNTFRGIAYIVLATGRHRAEVIRAEGWATSQVMRAKAELVDARRPLLLPHDEPLRDVSRKDEEKGGAAPS